MAKRINKKKPEIVQDIKQIQNATRMRDIVRQKIYPFLLELNDSIGYTKIFLQTSAATVENVFLEGQRTTKVGDLIPRLNEMFTTKDEAQKAEYEKYQRLFEILKDETVFDFNSMIQSMPRAIEQYFTHEIDRNKVMEIPIDKILG